MIRRMRQWIRRQQEWSADHRTSWSGTGNAGPDGLSRFQQQCMDVISRVLSGRGMSLANERMEGETERFVVVEVPALGAVVWIYVDGVCATSPSGEMRIEEWDTRSPDEMCQRIADFLRALRPMDAPPNDAVHPTLA